VKGMEGTKRIHEKERKDVESRRAVFGVSSLSATFKTTGSKKVTELGETERERSMRQESNEKKEKKRRIHDISQEPKKISSRKTQKKTRKGKGKGTQKTPAEA